MSIRNAEILSKIFHVEKRKNRYSSFPLDSKYLKLISERKNVLTNVHSSKEIVVLDSTFM